MIINIFFNQFLQDRRWSIPKINDPLLKFKCKTCISTLDLKGGYWHVSVKKSHQPKLAFLTKWGLYTWSRLPFGPKTAVMIFQSIMQQLFSDLDFVLVYLDDICIVSDSPKQHLSHPQQTGF